MNHKRLLVVITTTGYDTKYDLWEKFETVYEKWQAIPSQQANCNKYLEDGALWFKLDGCKSLLLVMLQDENLRNALDQLFQNSRNLAEYNIYIARHRQLEDNEKAFLEPYRIIGNLHFSHASGKPLYDALYTLAEGVRCENLDKVLNAFDRISFLKHHLAHLFLPLDIDLQGICEVLSSESSPPSGKSKDEWAEECYRKAKAYYDEAFNGKSPKEIFEEKLGKAKKIVESEAPDEVKNQILEKLEDNGVKDLKGQLGKPEPEGDLQTFKEWIKENNNPFHDWFCGSMEYLNEIKVEFQQTVRAE